MDSNGFHPQAKTRQQIESYLLAQLRQRQIAWIAASDQDRDVARQRFMNTLHSLNGFMFDGEIPQ